jgi:hypothetical protein
MPDGTVFQTGGADAVVTAVSGAWLYTANP